MGRIVVSAERVIDTPANQVYDILADYRTSHREILPPQFVEYQALEGGRGAGTLVSFRVRAGGRERAYTMRVSEPIPGSVLVETDTNSSLTTTFSLTPADEGRRTLVAIRTEWQGSMGVGGFFERAFAPVALRRIYDASNRSPTGIAS
jgi:uncharacterized protein YndB with AHSA1/START domain